MDVCGTSGCNIELVVKPVDDTVVVSGGNVLDRVMKGDCCCCDGSGCNWDCVTGTSDGTRECPGTVFMAVTLGTRGATRATPGRVCDTAVVLVDVTGVWEADTSRAADTSLFGGAPVGTTGRARPGVGG